jgi:hypothetical protein
VLSICLSCLDCVQGPVWGSILVASGSRWCPVREGRQGLEKVNAWNVYDLFISEGTSWPIAGPLPAALRVHFLCALAWLLGQLKDQIDHPCSLRTVVS